MTGAAAESELATALFLEQDVSGLDHIGIIGLEVRHFDDAPFTLEAHAGTARSLGRRIRL
jgi:hypothetical protein